MTMTRINDSGTVRTGVHVTAAPTGCEGCGHPKTLHSNGRTACRAAGCHAGPDGAPCEGYVAPAPALLAS
jgi:hypothetical protein